MKENGSLRTFQYDVHPSVTMIRSIIRKMPEKTGRSLEQWVSLVQNCGPETAKERKSWLKEEHKLGTNYAGWIAQRAEGKDWEDGDPEHYLKAASEYVDAMYSSGKSALRPLHDHLLDLALGLGDDVKVCPCKSIVPLYRKHVFAQIKPTTRSRIDLGLALKQAMKSSQLSDRLLDTGGLVKGDRITHRIAISTPQEIDDEVKRWLKIAYETDE